MESADALAPELTITGSQNLPDCLLPCLSESNNGLKVKGISRNSAFQNGKAIFVGLFAGDFSKSGVSGNPLKHASHLVEKEPGLESMRLFQS